MISTKTELKNLSLYYRTVKHLKPIQVRYRLWYMLRSQFRKLANHTYPLSISKQGHILNFNPGILKHSTFPTTLKLSRTGNNQHSTFSFTFLNQSHTFDNDIDWNFDEFGKLWSYNLNYFDYLHQDEISKEQGLELIYEFIDQTENNREGLEPYPISLRGMNWIKFLNQNEIDDSKIDASLYAQYQILLDNIEYHILGNHLMENGCSLLFGGYYFKDKELLKAAVEILNKQLDEQILADGGHFERSTMYHCIMLERLLDCYCLVKNNTVFRLPELKKKLKLKTQLMLGWGEQLAVI